MDQIERAVNELRRMKDAARPVSCGDIDGVINILREQPAHAKRIAGVKTPDPVPDVDPEWVKRMKADEPSKVDTREGATDWLPTDGDTAPCERTSYDSVIANSDPVKVIQDRLARLEEFAADQRRDIGVNGESWLSSLNALRSRQEDQNDAINRHDASIRKLEDGVKLPAAENEPADGVGVPQLIDEVIWRVRAEGSGAQKMHDGSGYYKLAAEDYGHAVSWLEDARSLYLRASACRDAGEKEAE